jgi:hypothetical protein
MSKMKKVTIQLGNYDGSQRNVVFKGELLKTREDLDIPDDESYGTSYDLYRVSKGYRVFERRWASGQGKKRQNYAKLSKVLTETELLKDFALLANEAGIFEKLDLDFEEVTVSEKTVLLAVNEAGARLLPYMLAKVEALMELGLCLLDQEDVPQDLKAELEQALGPFKPV